jgi:hypothetical protein
LVRLFGLHKLRTGTGAVEAVSDDDHKTNQRRTSFISKTGVLPGGGSVGGRQMSPTNDKSGVASTPGFEDDDDEDSPTGRASSPPSPSSQPVTPRGMQLPPGPDGLTHMRAGQKFIMYREVLTCFPTPSVYL